MTEQSRPNQPCRTEATPIRLLHAILLSACLTACATNAENAAPADGGATQPSLAPDAAPATTAEQQPGDSEAEDDDVPSETDPPDASSGTTSSAPGASPSEHGQGDASVDPEDSPEPMDGGDGTSAPSSSDASTNEAPGVIPDARAPDASVPELVPCGGCEVNGACIEDGETDPDNPCRHCDVTVATDSYSDADGAACDDGLFCNGGDTCAAGMCGVHTGDPCPDTVACNGDEICNEDLAECLPGVSICGGDEVCDIVTNGCTATCDGCSILGACYPDGTSNPSSPCQVCRSSSPTGWTDNDGAACDDGLFCSGGDTCAAGMCGVHSGDPCPDTVACNGVESCQEDADECADGTPTCAPGESCNVATDTCSTVCSGCLINGSCHSNGATRPGNPCQRCDTAQSPIAWSPNNGAACSDGLFCNGTYICAAGSCSVHAGDPCGDGVACNGTETCNETADQCVAGVTTCTQGQTCDPASDTCAATCAGCIVSGVCYADGSANPSNPCQRCDATLSPTAWSDDDGAACDDGMFCNGADWCSGGSCSGHAGDPCADDVACNGVETCDDSLDECDSGTSPCQLGQSCHQPTDTCQEDCDDGEYESSPPTQSNPRACSPVSDCQAGEYVTTEATETTDRQCSPCGGGSYSDSANASECASWTNCEAGQEVASEPSATEDRGCTDCTSGYSTEQNAGTCTPWRECEGVATESIPGTPTADRVCKPDWVAQFGTTLSDSPTSSSVSVGPGGDAFIAWRDTGGENVVSGSMFVSRLAAGSGAKVWERWFLIPSSTFQWGGADIDGGILLAGHTLGNLDGGGQGGNGDAFLLKRSAANGSLVWVTQFGGADHEGAYSCAVDDDGNFFVQTQWHNDVSDPLVGWNWNVSVTKLSGADRAELWSTPLDSSAPDNSQAVAVDPNGNVLIAGGTSGDLGGSGNAGLFDAFAAKLSGSNGTPLWVRQFGGAGRDGFSNIDADSVGDVLVLGTFDAQGTPQSVVMKLNGTDGDDLWTHVFDEHIAADVSSAADGTVLVAGSTAGAFDSRNAVVLGLSASDGTLIWVEELGTGVHDRASGLATDGLGNILVTGLTNGEMVQGAAKGGSDVFVFKLLQ